MTLVDIKDNNLKLYLSGSISLSDLQSRMKGFEPYNVIDGEVVALSDDEYAKRIARPRNIVKRRSDIERDPKGDFKGVLNNDYSMCLSDEEKKYVEETPARIKEYKRLIATLSPTKNILSDMLLIIPTYGKYDLLRHNALLATLVSLVSVQKYLPEIVLVEASDVPMYPELFGVPWMKYVHVAIDNRNYGGLFQKEPLVEYMIRNSSHKKLAWLDGDVTCDDPEWMLKLHQELDSDRDILVQCFEWFCDPLAGRGDSVSMGREKKENDKYWTAPGLAWSCNRSYVDKCPRPFLNPLAITGSGDILFIHEHYSTDVYKFQFDLGYYGGILRKDIPKADVSCVHARVTHVYHGHYNFRAYHWSQRAIDMVGNLNKFVCLDERGFLKWVTPNNALRSCLSNRRYMMSEEDTVNIARKALDEHPTLISPQHQKAIQIDITNVCSKKCSNCTRFCGHHKDPFFMTLDQFKSAVDSLSGYNGIVGIIGGEPTLHPMFEEFTKYIEEKRPDPSRGTSQYEFLPSFSKCHVETMKFGDWKKGLWTCLGPGYKRNYEVIQRAYRYQCINDHLGKSSHLALLLPRKELGISDDEWIGFRNRCWVQKLWSATITPKGAFFCEVAAALSHLLNESDGIAVEPGWWRKEPEEFGDQLKLCEYCSACLPVPSKLDSDETDQVSRKIYERLRSLGSKKSMEIVSDDWETLKSKYKANLSCAPYLETSDGLRVHEPTGLETGDVTCIIVCRGYDDFLERALPSVVRELKKVIVLTSADDVRTKNVAVVNGAECRISRYLNGDFRKGSAINEALLTLPNRWVVLLDADIVLPYGFGDLLRHSVLNPGALYYTERRGPLFYDTRLSIGLAELATRTSDWDKVWETCGDMAYVQREPLGFCQVFNTSSSVLRDKQSLYPTQSETAEFDDFVFAKKWYGLERCVLLPQPQARVLHLAHGESGTNWKGRASRRLDDEAWWVEDHEVLYRTGWRSGVCFVGLYRLAKSLNIPDGSVIVEVGSMLGDGAIIWASLYPNVRVITVDVWHNEQIYQEALKRTWNCKNIETWRMTSLEARDKCVADGISPNVVYIDANHSEPCVVSDICAWKPILAKGGVLCGHDYAKEWPGVMKAVDDLLGKPTTLFEDSSWIGFVNE